MQKIEKQYDLVIVGGRFCGAMVAVQLARTAPPNWRAALFDKTGTFGKGVAYGTTFPLHLLNVPAGKMSAFPEAPNHFVDWLQRHPEVRARFKISQFGSDSFLPRALYGAYIASLFEQTLLERPGFAAIAEEVVDLEASDGGTVCLTTASGRNVTAGKAVLALGNFPPGDPPTRDAHFHRSPHYLTNPWSPETLKAISHDDEIVILGSGLTCLDLLMQLHPRTTGRIHVISRRGLFPQPHRPASPATRFISAEVSNRSLRQILRTARATIRNVEAIGGDWRPVVDALRPHTASIWAQLSLVEKRRFVRHLRPYWESHRHRAAPTILALKDEMIRRKQLVLHRGRVTRLTDRREGILVWLHDRAAGYEKWIGGRYVVNCTGPECNYQKLKAPLLMNLFLRGLAHPDPLFQGLLTDARGALINYRGQVSSNIFTLGSPRRGTLLETTAVPELRAQAQELAGVLCPGNSNITRSGMMAVGL
jgi:uncharacterized NAD(P)/FAD-binding protein YdhS